MTDELLRNPDVHALVQEILDALEGCQLYAFVSSDLERAVIEAKNDQVCDCIEAVANVLRRSGFTLSRKPELDEVEASP